MNTKLAFSICLCGLLLVACSSSKQLTSGTDNTLSNSERNDGWQLLFDGTSTEGWHTYGRSAAGQAWKVSNGVLYFDTTRVNGRRAGGGDITTNKEYENFHLKLEWKIAPGGNSGVIFLVNEDTAKYRATYATGLEMQVIDNNGHADAKILKHRAGDLYDLIASSKETVRPLDQWNLAEIKMNKGKLDLYLNGENIVSTELWNDNWKTLVDNSKFKTWGGFAKFRRGKIALQDHGDMVWFRNIKIKEL